MKHKYRYLSLPPSRQDLTQDLFYSEGLREGESRARAEIRALSSAHLVQCEQDEPAGLGYTWYYMNPARVPVQSLN